MNSVPSFNVGDEVDYKIRLLVGAFPHDEFHKGVIAEKRDDFYYYVKVNDNKHVISGEKRYNDNGLSLFRICQLRQSQKGV
jgi:hypothetical protein